MKILLQVFFIGVVLLATSCKSARHALQFRNVSNEIVNFSTEGIQLYAEEGGPQELKNVCHPNIGGGYNVFGPLRLSYPVKVSWESKQSDKKGCQEFMHIPGIPEGVEKVTEGGVLVVGLTPDFELKVFFVRGDLIDSKLYEQMLKGEVPLPE